MAITSNAEATAIASPRLTFAWLNSVARTQRNGTVTAQKAMTALDVRTTRILLLFKSDISKPLVARALG